METDDDPRDFLAEAPKPIEPLPCMETDDDPRDFLAEAPKLIPYTGHVGLIDEPIRVALGNTILRHHMEFSDEPYGKERFEYGLVRAFMNAGRQASKAPRGRSGYDVELEGLRFNLKTQADKELCRDFVLISKYMEIGKGPPWTHDPATFQWLKTKFLEHLADYRGVLMLRSYPYTIANFWHYELLEIPLAVLAKAEETCLQVADRSDTIPPAIHSFVQDAAGPLFKLNFQGGGERKMSVCGIRRDACILHSEWSFTAPRKE
jgi:type II restriction enzyme